MKLTIELEPEQEDEIVSKSLIETRAMLEADMKDLESWGRMVEWEEYQKDLEAVIRTLKLYTVTVEV